MSKLVFILGAGASVSAGAPMMGNFLDVAKALSASGEVSDAQADFNTVFEGINRLQAVAHKSYIDTENLEAVFIAFEAGEMLARLAPPTGIRAQAPYSTALRRVIVRTLEQTIHFPRSNDRRLVPNLSYGDLASFCANEYRKDPGAVSIITFNYDVALDFALYQREIPPNYCTDPNDTGGFPLMKLHGSLNWFRGAKRGAIKALPLGGTMMAYGVGPDVQHLRMSRVVANLPEKEKAPFLLPPVIVPPTWGKGDEHQKLRSVWQRAAQHLSEATRIVIVGYSFPSTDEFFRYLFALGTVGPTWLLSIHLVNPSIDQFMLNRFKSILGRRSLSRFYPVRDRFEGVCSIFADRQREPFRILTDLSRAETW